jgi:hypothetical protein
MKPAVGMVLGSVVTAAVAALVAEMAGAGAGQEIWLGMLAPLVVAVASWLLVERTFRRDPLKVTNVMVAAFGAKLLIFGAYIAVMLRGLALRPVPLIVSFTAYFVGLHFAEALCLRRLFAGGASGGR